MWSRQIPTVLSHIDDTNPLYDLVIYLYGFFPETTLLQSNHKKNTVWILIKDMQWNTWQYFLK